MFESHFLKAFAILDMVSLCQEMMPAVKQLTVAGGLPALLTISVQDFDLEPLISLS